MIGQRIAVVDYGAGNILNVLRILDFLGARPQLAESPNLISRADKIVIPGVGAFGQGVQKLSNSGIADAIYAAAEQEVPLLAICLGMQLLSNSSEESAGQEGLKIIPGEVVSLGSLKPTPSAIRIPNTGWDDVNFHRSMLGVSAYSSQQYYSSHSFFMKPEDESVVVATKEVGAHKIPMIVNRRSILGVQFHPEKSGQQGLDLISAWLNTT